MNTPWPPPTSNTTPVEQPVCGFNEQRRRLAHPVALFAACVAVGSIIATAAGLAIGFIAYSSSAGNCTPHDGWCELGATVLGLAAGVCAGILGYLTAVVTMVRRFRPQGQRAAQIATHIAIPIALVVLAMVIQAIQEL